MKDKCVGCGKETQYDKDTPIKDKRVSTVASRIIALAMDKKEQGFQVEMELI